MPASKNRKNHKQKVGQFKQKVQSDRKKSQEALIKMYNDQLQQRKQNMQPIINGENVENTDIDVDIDVDINDDDNLYIINESDEINESDKINNTESLN